MINSPTGFAVKTGRDLKAKKIEAVLKDFLSVDSIEGFDILDIGCGSGIIAQYFAGKNRVTCVDIQNNLMPGMSHKVSLQIVDSAILPFKDNMFDIVISNHIIEHLSDQSSHLKEIYRVLKSKGICYLATPNANFPIEPHYNIPLLHYLPSKIYFKILKIIKIYCEDILLLTYKQQRQVFIMHDYNFKEYTSSVLKKPMKYFIEVKWTKCMPLWILNKICWLAPTNIYILTTNK